MKTFTVGIFVRRQVRRALMEAGADFSEDRGWIDSLFCVRDANSMRVQGAVNSIIRNLA